MNYTINKNYKCEYEIKKSVFISTLIPVSNLEECQERLKEIRKEYYDATHNCYSYIINNSGSYIIKNSDDGEPSKTAGIVIYDVLKKQNLENVLCVITRYFGGIKLGAGGLVRAYSKATSDVVNLIEKIKIEELTPLSIEVDYTSVNDILSSMNKYKQEAKDFKENAKFVYLVPAEKKAEIVENLIKITKNKIKIGD